MLRMMTTACAVYLLACLVPFICGMAPPVLTDIPYKMKWQALGPILNPSDFENSQFIIATYTAYINQTSGRARIVGDDGSQWIIQTEKDVLISIQQPEKAAPECTVSKFSELADPLWPIFTAEGETPALPGRNQVFGLTPTAVQEPLQPPLNMNYSLGASGIPFHTFIDNRNASGGESYSFRYGFTSWSFYSDSFNATESVLSFALTSPSENPINNSRILKILSTEGLSEDDWEQFEIPPGVYCPGQPLINITIPEDLEMAVEATEPIQKLYHIFYDYDHKLFRVDTSVGHESGQATYGSTQMTIIQDYKEGYQYTVNQLRGSCEVGPIDLNVTGSLGQPDNGDSRFVHLGNQDEIQRSKNFTFHSMRMIRGTVASVYTHKEGNTVHERFFGKLAYCDHVGGMNPAHPQLGSATYVDGTKTAQVGIFAFSACPLSWRVFDVYLCSQGLDVERAEMMMQLKSTSRPPTMGFFRDSAEKAMRNWLAGVMGITALHVSELYIYIDYDTPDIMFVFFTVLDRQSAKGNVANPPKEAPIAVALEKLHAISGNFAAPYLYDNLTQYSWVYTVTPDSVTKFTGDDGADKRTGMKKPMSYSSSSMAGLGFGMLILGAVLALVFAYVVLRKRLHLRNPYSQDIQ